MRFIPFLAFLVLFSTASSAEELPPEIFISETTTKKFVCAKLSNRWMPVVMKRKSVQKVKDEIRKLKQKEKISKNTIQKSKLKEKILKLKAYNKDGKKACKTGPPSELPAPDNEKTPRPTPSPAPTNRPPSFGAAPPPVNQTGNFDQNGNVTEKGKLLFQIPSGLSANIQAGRIVFENNSCDGCHMERTNRTFKELKFFVPYSPMFISLSDQDFADLAAYLNRLRK